MSSRKIVIIGAGPAGLTAGYELKKRNKNFIIFEKEKEIGGIAKTVKYKNFRFDIGGHRFFSKSDVINKIWKEILPAGDWLQKDRLSRIYYDNSFFDYPLKIDNVVKNLGLKRSLAIVLSFINSKLFPIKDEKSFEDWIVNRFGWRLYKTFFKSYTEKLWGIPCEQIRADWAAQRIRGLSFTSAVKDALLRQIGFKNSEAIKTLITSFAYPKYGPGMMWQAMSRKILKGTNKKIIKRKTKVIKIILNKNTTKVKRAIIKNERGKEESVKATALFSSMPIDELILSVKPTPQKKIIKAAKDLRYRDFIQAALVFKMKDSFPDNWIYIHDPQAKMLRVQNFKNWSSYLVPSKKYTCLGTEYTCNVGDKIWSLSDRCLKNLAKRELVKTGLVSEKRVVLGGKVARMRKAYPVYNGDYKKSVRIIKSFLKKIKNVYPIGRSGMFKYNNMDHSMLTAILSVRNFCEKKSYNVWEINTEEKYHEEKQEY